VIDEATGCLAGKARYLLCWGGGARVGVAIPARPCLDCEYLVLQYGVL